jgi:hypothetical protein
MHAFVKMPHNMLKFVSANNFSGNIAIDPFAQARDAAQ